MMPIAISTKLCVCEQEKTRGSRGASVPADANFADGDQIRQISALETQNFTTVHQTGNAGNAAQKTKPKHCDGADFSTPWHI